MSVQPPPIYEPVVAKEDTKARLPWILFFNQIFNGDAGTEWTPTFVDLTQVGTPTISGIYYRISQYLVYFSVRIVPATSTTSVAGTTYIDNFPLAFSADGACLAVSGGTGSGAGMIQAISNKIFTPAWAAVTVPLTIVGIASAR